MNIAKIKWARNVEAQARANSTSPEDEIWTWEFSDYEFDSDEERHRQYSLCCEEYRAAIKASKSVRLSHETFSCPNLADDAGRNSGKRYLVQGPFGATGNYSLITLTEK